MKIVSKMTYKRLNLCVCVLFITQINALNLHSSRIANAVRKNGYPFEEHGNIETPDNYLLTMFRIPYGRLNSNESIREPVLLMHGLFGSGENFLASGPKNALGYLLADQGYDVWLGNVRGTSNSRYHKTLNPDKDKEFWDFSLTELGIYDLPTKIDYILNVTKMNKIFYIGHSQGNIMMFIMCSELPEYNEKIKLFMALSPVAYMGNMSHPWFGKLGKLEKQLRNLTDYLGIYELIPGRALINLFGPIICPLPVINDICATLLTTFVGLNLDQLNKSNIPEIVKSTPDSLGAKQLYHIFQYQNTGLFRMFDYGKEINLLKYNAIDPPSFCVQNTRIPTALFYSKNDWFLALENVFKVRDELPNVVLSHQIEDETFTHVDFLWAKDVVKLLYNRIFELMYKYRINTD